MKKVLIVIPTLEQGGGQKFVMDLVKGIDKEKFQIKILVYYKNTNSVFDQYAHNNCFDVVYLDKNVGLDITMFKKVKKVVKEYNPDIIHTHLHSMLYLFTSYKKKQVKLHTVHTLAEKEAVGLQGVVRFIAYKLLGVTPVAICGTVADSISTRHHIDKSKIPVVYNGVDCNRYDIPRVSSDKIRLVTIGNIYDVKNYSFLVDCFSETCKKIDDVTLTIVGDGVLRTDLEQQISNLNLNDKVKITGIVPDVENYLSDADIYVASSIFEGLPLSMLEAMSAGLPIVSTNVGGVHDIVENEKNGILIDFGDKLGYVNAMNKLILDSNYRRCLSQKSKENSLKYDEKLCVKGYERLYVGSNK